MQYMIMLQETPEDTASRANDKAPGYWASWMAYAGALPVSRLIVMAGSTAVCIYLQCANFTPNSSNRRANVVSSMLRIVRGSRARAVLDERVSLRTLSAASDAWR